jgi:indolepyruvate ferredoxin oxidoreductase alpha subunit
MSSPHMRASGAQALAQGALDAGVGLVLGYPGSPATAVVDEIARRTGPEQVRVDWTSNEKVALEVVFGGSIAGVRSLLCVKSVGLNVALDPLMAIDLCGCSAGLVLLVGDDPGGWGSQNEQDSRTLALMAEIPLLEPTTVPSACLAMREAFELSTEEGTPVMVRVTRALVEADGDLAPLAGTVPPVRGFRRSFMEWVVLPANVVERHQRLHARLQEVQARFERSELNTEQGDGHLGIVAAGFAYQKLLDLFDGPVPGELRILGLGTAYRLPVARVRAFLERVDRVLVLEETAPVIERAIRAEAQLAGIQVPIYGRDTGHIADAGELFGPGIAQALNRLSPDLSVPERGETSRPMPSRRPLCEDCPYIPTFKALLSAIEGHGGREQAIVVGDPGCMVRAQLPPYRLLDVKYSLGSSIGTGAGLALGQQLTGQPPRHVIALCGDSSLLHTGLNGLMDAAHLGAQMSVVVLENGATALSGGQPHPGNATGLRGEERPAVDLLDLVRAAGTCTATSVDSTDGQRLQKVFAQGMEGEGLAVVIVRAACPRYVARDELPG